MDASQINHCEKKQEAQKAELLSRLHFRPENSEVLQVIRKRNTTDEHIAMCNTKIHRNPQTLFPRPPESEQKNAACIMRTVYYKTDVDKTSKLCDKERSVPGLHGYLKHLKENHEKVSEQMIKKHHNPSHQSIGEPDLKTLVHSVCNLQLKPEDYPVCRIPTNKPKPAATVESSSCGTFHLKSQQQHHIRGNCPESWNTQDAQYDVTEPEDDRIITHIERLRKNLNWSTELPKQSADTSYESEVERILLESMHPRKEDEGEYVYCLLRNRNNPKSRYDPYDLQVVSANKAKCSKMYWTVSASFVCRISVMAGSNHTEIIPVTEWLYERELFYMVFHLPVFVKFSVWKAFTVWKANVRSSKNEKCKAIISKQLFFVDELFRGCLLYIQSLCEDAFSTKGGNELIGTAIHLVKTDRCHTCSLEEFCSLQAEQCNYAHKQLQAFRSKVIEMIKLTCLKVAEMDGAQDCFLSVLFDSKDKSKYAVMPYWRNLVSRFVRFLKLVDNIFQEMLCCLLSSEVQRLLEFFSVSAAFSEEVKKELRSYF